MTKEETLENTPTVDTTTKRTDKRTETHGVCLDDLIKRTDAIKALDDILRVFIDLGLSCAYDMPSFWYNEKKNYKVIPTKYHIGYQQALKDSEQKIKKIMEKLCYG